DATARRNVVWALTRSNDPKAAPAIRAALGDPDETVRHAAIHSTSVRRDGAAVGALLKLLTSGTAQDRRAAAEALGRLGDKTLVRPWLAAAGKPTIRALENSVTYALIKIADPKATAEGLKSDNPLTRRAALVALDQMDGGGLDVKTVMPDLLSANPVLKETAS